MCKSQAARPPVFFETMQWNLPFVHLFGCDSLQRIMASPALLSSKAHKALSLANSNKETYGARRLGKCGGDLGKMC